MLTKEQIDAALTARHGAEVQKKLAAASVAVAGCGGLGSNVAVALARIGVGHLHLIDFDQVDITNLNRQHFFMKHLGRNKPEALAEQIKEINPYLDIRTTCVKITEDNLTELLGDADIICEAFDVAEQKAMLVNGVLENLPDKKLVAASGMAGYGGSNDIHTRKITGNFYLCGDEVTEPEMTVGLMAPRVAICAGHEANLITELILSEK